MTLEGRLKVLDFGLAKAMTAEAPAADPMSSPTLTMRAMISGYRAVSAKCGSQNAGRSSCQLCQTGGDDSMRQMADRIQASAIRRCGQLLKQIAPRESPGRPAKTGAGAVPLAILLHALGAAFHCVNLSWGL